MDVGKLTLRIAGVVAGIIAITLSIWFGSNAGSLLLPSESSVEAVMIDHLFEAMLVIASIIFLGVQGVILYSIFRFRQQAGDTTDGPPVHGNIPLEVLWTAIPAALVLWVSVYSYDVSSRIAVGGSGGLGCSVDCPMIQKVANPNGKELLVNVIAQQFGWTFQYPGYSPEEVGELHVPAGREVILTMTSKDVLHAFWVPDFRLKQDVIPGRAVRLKFTATKTGEYPLVCAELCGAYHGAMRNSVFVDDGKAFEAWRKENLPEKSASVPSSTAIALNK